MSFKARSDPHQEQPLASYFALLDRVLVKGRERAALMLLHLETPLRQEDLGRVQVALREEATEWDFCAQYMQGGLGKGLRSAIITKAIRLVRLLSREEPDYSDRTFWVAVQTWSLADAVIRGIRAAHLNLQDADISWLHGYTAGSAVKMLDAPRRVSEQAEQILQIIRDVMANISEVARRELPGNALLELCGNENVVAEIASPVFSTSAVRIRSRSDYLLIKPWVYTKLIRLLGLQKYELQVLCECYLPSEGGDLLVAASSSQRVPGPPPPEYGKRLVPKGYLQGGVAITTRSFLPNDRPTLYTNSHHDEEGRPVRTLSVPIEVKARGKHRYGQLYVALLSERAPSIEDIPDFVDAVLCLAGCLSRQLSGTEPEFPWHVYRKAVHDSQSFRMRISAEIREHTREDGIHAEKIGFVVVSARSAVSDRTRSHSVAHVLDNWARFTALRISKEQPVFRLDDLGSYVFVSKDPDSTLWTQEGGEWDFGRGAVAEAYSPDGVRAGSLGIWPVVWRSDILFAANEALGNRIEELIEGEVKVAAEAVMDLNDLISHYARGNYKRAFAIARRMIAFYGGDFGFMINEAARLALLKDDVRTALDYSRARRDFAVWDPESHTNYLLSLLAAGDIDAAVAELQRCDVCRSYQEGLPERLRHGQWAYPMLGVILAFVQSLLAINSGVQFDLRRQMEACLQLLAGSVPSYRRAVRSALDEVIRYMLGHRSENPAVLIDDMLLDLDEADIDREGRIRHWEEIAALRTILLVLRGTAFHAQAGARSASMSVPAPKES